MLRPKSAGGSRSFLDDLLGNDLDPLDSGATSASIVTAGQRQRKSVRFFDQDEDNVGLRGRPHSSTLDSLLNVNRAEANLTRPHSSEASNLPGKSKSDWLGLARDEESTAHRMAGEVAQDSSQGSVALQNSQRTDSLSKSTESSDWITAGLRSRQSKSSESEGRPSFLQGPPSTATNKTSTTNEQRPWQPKIIESSIVRAQVPVSIGPMNDVVSQVSTGESFAKDEPQRDSLPTTVTVAENSKPVDETKSEQDQTVKRSTEEEQRIGEIESVSESQSAVFLQTKLRILSLEKTFLEQTVEQMKSNHHDELRAMVSLYEQQMRMTSEMYKRHEEMIQEERDRRIAELRSQLDHSEEEMQEMRHKFQKRLTTVESEWKADVHRIRDSNSISTAELTKQHQQEVLRLEQRLKSDNEESIQTSTDLVKRHNNSVTELLARWEQSAHKIEQLQRSVVARQEDLIRQQSVESEQIVSNKFVDIEIQWKAFVVELQQQRIQLEQVIKAEQEKNNSDERKIIDEQKIQIQGEKQELQLLRSQFSDEVNQWRQSETEEAQKLHQQRDKLRLDVIQFEERRSMLETLYTERKRTIEEEQARVDKQSEQFALKRSQLDQEQTQFNKAILEIQVEQQQHSAKKELFNREKEQLTQMALSLSKRAEELEKLSEVALKEKLDGIQVMDEMDSVQSEINNKMANIEDSSVQLRKEQQRLALERAQLDQQWAMLKELKDSIVCNLCGNALNRVPSAANYSFAMFSQRSNSNIDRAGQPNQSGQLFYSLLNGGYGMRQNIAANDVASYWLRNEAAYKTGLDLDQDLLFWQKSAQQDQISLVEETKFLNVVKNKYK